jgi:hypothetical protein
MTGAAIIVSIAILAIASVSRPSRARCPAGYDLRTGIRRDGRYQCWPHPVGDPEWDGTWQRPERGTQPNGILEGRIYCTGGARPIARDDGRTVGCQR